MTAKKSRNTRAAKDAKALDARFAVSNVDSQFPLPSWSAEYRSVPIWNSLDGDHVRAFAFDHDGNELHTPLTIQRIRLDGKNYVQVVFEDRKGRIDSYAFEGSAALDFEPMAFVFSLLSNRGVSFEPRGIQAVRKAVLEITYGRGTQ
jgi:hypothetical protein